MVGGKGQAKRRAFTESTTAFPCPLEMLGKKLSRTSPVALSWTETTCNRCHVAALLPCDVVVLLLSVVATSPLRLSGTTGTLPYPLSKGIIPALFPLPGRLGKETCFILPDKSALGKGWGLGGKGNPASVGGGFSLPPKEYVHSRLVVTWRRHWGRRAACLPGCSRQCASGSRA